MLVRTILDRKTANVITISSDATIKQAVDEMHQSRVAALVVKTGDTVVGIVSERDIVAAVAQHDKAALSFAVKQIAGQAITISKKDSVKRAMSLMTQRRTRHLLVTEKDEPTEIISIGDVVKYRLEELELESQVLRDGYLVAHAFSEPDGFQDSLL